MIGVEGELLSSKPLGSFILRRGENKNVGEE